MSRLKYPFFLILCFAVRAFAQVSTATVIGVVLDSSNASIPNASVKLINTQTGTENDSTTNRRGGFILPGVIPGAYTLQIERGGFATTQLNGILLNIGDTKNLLIRMRVGSVSETVTVDASGLTLNDTDAAVSTVVDPEFVEGVPLNGRSFQDLISMTPGIVTQNPQAAGGGGNTQEDFSVNGQQPESNAFIVDGVSANVNSDLDGNRSRLSSTGSAAGSTALGTTQSLVSIDALQEFRVLSSTYSAEYGRTPGGQFTFATRSGTNTLHGSIYEYIRNRSLDSSDWFSPSGYNDEAPYHQNDFGGALGGPIILPGGYRGRDKSFFFLSYEGLYIDQPTPFIYAYTPGGILDEVPKPLQPVLDTFPGANGQEFLDASGNPTGLSQALIFPYSFPAQVNSTSVRIDHAYSPKLSMFLRYGGTPSYSQTGQLFSVTNNHVDTQTVTFGATNQLSATRNNEFRLGYVSDDSILDTRTSAEDAGTYDGFNPSVNLNTALGIPASYSSVRAQAYVHVVGVGDSESYTNQSSGSFRQWNLRDTYGLEYGKHSFKFGIDERRIDSGVIPAPLSVQADFFDGESLLNNLASYIVVTQSKPANPTLNQFSAFAEDEWKASKALTLSFGLRWEINPPPKGEHGNDAFTVEGDVESPATLKLAPRGTPLWHTSWYNFAPRLGAAWQIDPEPGRALILRAGGGVFFDTGNQPALSAFTGIGFTASAYSSNMPVPVTQSQLDISTAIAPPYTNTTVYAFPSHLQLPYSIQWNIALEKALSKIQSVTVSYVGADGRRLLQEQRRNLSQLNPNFGDVSYFPSDITSSYQSLQVKFQRSLSHGVDALASYTWAHALNYGSTAPEYPLAYGSSDLDVRHNLEAALSWDFPRPSGGRFLMGALKRWGLDGRLIARTGFPVNLSGNFFFDPVTGIPYYSGVNLIPNRPLYLHFPRYEYPGGRIFNGGLDAANPAFSLPSGTEQGDAPRNLLRGFDEVQANITLRRDFHIHDRMNLRFRVDTFNVFNHPNFGYIDPYLSDLLFGQATKMLNQSFGGTGALYEQGGPRSIQFSLKLTF